MNLDFYPLRFEFTTKDVLSFPPGKASNILRGALGTVFRRLACVPACRDPKTCNVRYSCPYAKTFEPVSEGGPSGLADSPRPFVFRARHLDACTIQQGQRFHFDLHLFTPDASVLAGFIQTFAALGTEGLGP